MYNSFLQTHFDLTFGLLYSVLRTIAAIGLLESSDVSLVASMLISPLMGPIMAGEAHWTFRLY